MKIFTITNFLAMQSGWLLTVFAAQAGYPAAGVLFTLGWLSLHLWARPDDRAIDLRIVLAAVALGASCDSLLALFGIIVFAPQAVLGEPTTAWMVALWVNLALALRYSLGWLRGRYLLAAALGAFAGPLAYFGGAKIGAINFPDTGYALSFVALEWMSAMPALMLVTAWSEALARHETQVADAASREAYDNVS